jgi:toxin ParE1/3/4
VNVKWSRCAIDDRDDIFDYIESSSPQNASLVDERIRDQVRCLSKFPEMGRPGRMPGTRELLVRGTPFIVAYRALSDTVHVLRVLHSARRWPITGPKRRLGFMAGEIADPDDFDRMGTE